MRRIKRDPNPRGQENFFFINALNEWGEGNVLEPSRSWGDQFSKAFRAAKDYADTSLPWAEDLMRQGEELEAEVLDANSQVDVCVIIRDSSGKPGWSAVWQLQETLWSLQAQHNTKWRAVVVPVNGAETAFSGIETQVLDTYDPRIKAVEYPEALRLDIQRNSSDDVTDWAIQNIDTLHPSCSRATYMLITNAATTYEPHTFDVASRKRTDIIGLNFHSPSTRTLQTGRTGELTWDQRCTRLSASAPAQLCERMAPDNTAILDLSAALVSLARWRQEAHSLRAAADAHGGASVALLPELAARANAPWEWAAPASGLCDVIYAETYLACIATGHTWFDGPEVGGYTSGCYSGEGLTSEFYEENIPVHWDYQRFKHEDPSCVRLSESRYGEVMAGTVVSPEKTDWLVQQRGGVQYYNTE